MKVDWTDHALAIGGVLAIVGTIVAGIFFPIVWIVLSWAFGVVVYGGLAVLVLIGIYKIFLEGVLMLRRK